MDDHVAALLVLFGLASLSLWVDLGFVLHWYDAENAGNDFLICACLLPILHAGLSVEGRGCLNRLIT